MKVLECIVLYGLVYGSTGTQYSIGCSAFSVLVEDILDYRDTNQALADISSLSI